MKWKSFEGLRANLFADGEQHGTRGRPSGVRLQSHGLDSALLLDPGLGQARRQLLLRPRHFLMSRCPSVATRGPLPQFSLLIKGTAFLPAALAQPWSRKQKVGEEEGGRGRGKPRKK